MTVTEIKKLNKEIEIMMTQPIKFAVKYKLNKLHKEVQEIVLQEDNNRLELLNKYASIAEGATNYDFNSPDDLDKFYKEYDEVGKEVITLNHSFNLIDFENVTHGNYQYLFEFIKD